MRFFMAFCTVALAQFIILAPVYADGAQPDAADCALKRVDCDVKFAKDKAACWSQHGSNETPRKTCLSEAEAQSIQCRSPCK